MHLFTNSVGCQPCVRVKEFINDNNLPLVDFDIVDIQTDRDTAVKAGIRSVPTIRYDGKQLSGDHDIINFLRDKYEL
tara:strand:- start:3727 stop:3957 length:231 start_codon:yes stop_codon:yes gene_type:complete